MYTPDRMTVTAPAPAAAKATPAQKVLDNLERGKVSAESAAGVLREAALQAAAPDSGELVEETLRTLVDSGVLPEGVRAVLQAILDSGLVDDFVNHVLVPSELVLFRKVRELARGACACVKGSAAKT